jgi:hypothetical protein
MQTSVATRKISAQKNNSFGLAVRPERSRDFVIPAQNKKAQQGSLLPGFASSQRYA